MFLVVEDLERLSRTSIRRAENYVDLPLASLEAGVQIRRCLDHIAARAVEVARQKGATWEDIAEAMGVTRQAVYQKYRNQHEAPDMEDNGSDPESLADASRSA